MRVESATVAEAGVAVALEIGYFCFGENSASASAARKVYFVVHHDFVGFPAVAAGLLVVGKIKGEIAVGVSEANGFCVVENDCVDKVDLGGC